ncbi:TIGR01777 family oxidoreductase [Virgibacillus ainsalahensis]
MNILITGGTGFVGKNLTTNLQEKKHHIYILTRSPDKYHDTDKTTYISYDYPIEKLPAIHAVINLAGESLFGYWSKQKKETILKSRVETTRQVIRMMEKMNKKPEVFISGSAVGYYGISEDLIFTEETTDPGEDFLAEVAVTWEEAAKEAETLGIRTVYARFGVILGNEGALPLMRLPVKLLVGGKIGNGEQWLSWVHIEDVAGLIEFCLLHKEMVGPVNVTAPNPKRNKDFTKILAAVLKRPYWLKTPSPILHASLGEMSQLITKGQYVYPKKALDTGYQFVQPKLKEALQAIHTKND